MCNCGSKVRKAPAKQVVKRTPAGPTVVKKTTSIRTVIKRPVR